MGLKERWRTVAVVGLGTILVALRLLIRPSPPKTRTNGFIAEEAIRKAPRVWNHSARARLVYIDMGANWANTLRLYYDIAPKELRDRAWEIYAFEASPIIQPYVDKFVHYLNGKGNKPELTVPPSGSTRHLNAYAPYFGCPASLTDGFVQGQMRQCMYDTFEPALSALHAEPYLNSKDLIEARLAEASTPLAENATQSRFTFVPAAVGGVNGWLCLHGVDRHQAIRGGAAESTKLALDPNDLRGVKVSVTDVVSWIMRNFSPHDYVILKMDAEGAEFPILEGLYRAGQLGLVDLLAYECHEWIKNPASYRMRTCEDMAKVLKEEQVPTMMETDLYEGWDSFSQPKDYLPLDPRNHTYEPFVQRANIGYEPQCRVGDHVP
mmetsp:Transcript_8252/g.19408  ORF Transcript_8252/g.19408 Transcript_8252/m.19408 type:complete len:379 (+) Transcript_8252:37-1173(+)